MFYYNFKLNKVKENKIQVNQSHYFLVALTILKQLIPKNFVIWLIVLYKNFIIKIKFITKIDQNTNF